MVPARTTASRRLSAEWLCSASLAALPSPPGGAIIYGVMYSAVAVVLRAALPFLDVALTVNICVISPGPAFCEELRPWNSLLTIKLEKKAAVCTEDPRMALGHILFSQSLL